MDRSNRLVSFGGYRDLLATTWPLKEGDASVTPLASLVTSATLNPEESNDDDSREIIRIFQESSTEPRVRRGREKSGPMVRNSDKKAREDC